jgi:hypothetical protein
MCELKTVSEICKVSLCDQPYKEVIYKEEVYRLLFYGMWRRAQFYLEDRCSR